MTSSGLKVRKLHTSPSSARGRLCGLGQSPNLSEQSVHLGHERKQCVKPTAFCSLNPSMCVL